MMKKIPIQKRSRDMVDKIIEATGQVIAEYGLADTTTNRIADVAGVNIASLYQYFSDKNDLIEALVEKLCQDATRQVAQNFERNRYEIDERDLYSATRSGLRLSLAFLRSNTLHLELLRHWQHLPVEGAMNHLEVYFTAYCREYFTRHFQEYPVENLHARLYVLINCVLLLMVRYLGSDAPPISEKELLDTVTNMMVLLMKH
jgi:AcrR family transcriptional regulator